MMVRHLITYLMPNLAQAAASFGTVAVLTRLLSDAEYGRYYLIFTAMTLAHYISLTWIEAAAARFYAEADEKGEKPIHFATLKRAYVWCASIFAVLAVGLVLAYPGDLALKIALGAAFGGIFARSIIKIGLETRRMARQANRFAIVDTLHTLLGFGLGIGCVVVFASGPEGPFIGLLLAALIVLCIEGPAFWQASEGAKPDADRMKAFATYGAPLAGGLILSLALTSGDRFIIAHFLGEAEVGAYSAGYQIPARMLDIIFAWGSTAITPLLVAAYERGGKVEAAKVAYDGYAIRLGIGAPAALGIALLATPICEFLIGEGLRDRAAEIVPWVALAALMMGMCDYFSEAFMLAKKALQRALLMLVPTALNIGLNFILLPRIGLMGAVWSSVAAYGAGMLLLAVIGRRYIKLPIPLGETLKIAVACGVMCGLLLVLPDFGGLGEILFKAALGSICYGCIVLLLNVANARRRLNDLLANRKARRAAP
jgi:O-antigen/teichoic acid export membrane protein